MPRLLRAGIRPDRWFIYPEISWLAAGEVQADAIGDLRTTGNTLSVFEVNDQVDVERIAIAVAAGREKPTSVGYAIFDGDALTTLGLQIQKTPGKTADITVNSLHYDIQQLSGAHLIRLAGVILGGTINQILPKRVKELIRAGLAAGYLDRNLVNQKLVSQL